MDDLQKIIDAEQRSLNFSRKIVGILFVVASSAFLIYLFTFGILFFIMDVSATYVDIIAIAFVPALMFITGLFLLLKIRTMSVWIVSMLIASVISIASLIGIIKGGFFLVLFLLIVFLGIIPLIFLLRPSVTSYYFEKITKKDKLLLVLVVLIMAFSIFTIINFYVNRNNQTKDGNISTYIGYLDDDTKKYYARNQKLPEKIEEITKMDYYEPDALNSIDAGQIKYKKTGEFTYDICGNFITEEINQSGISYPKDGHYFFSFHEKGNFCFILDVRIGGF